MTKKSVPPSSPEAEQAVLGAIFVRPQVLDKICDFLGSGDFYREAHGTIYEAMLDLFRAGQPVDLVTVTARLREQRKLDEVGGPVFLAGLSEQVGFATNADFYAKEVHDTATLRHLLRVAQRIEKACVSPRRTDITARELVEQAQSQIAEILEGAKFTGSKGLARRLREYAESREGEFDLPRLYKDLGIVSSNQQKAALMALKRMVDEGAMAKPRPGVYRMVLDEAVPLKLSDAGPMGREIDLKYPFGLEKWFVTFPKTIVLVAGEPDAGKTMWMLNVAHDNFHLAPIHYWTSEMGLPELRRRVSQFDDFNFVGAAEWDKHVHFAERGGDFADVVKLFPNDVHIIDNLEMDDEFYRVGSHVDAIWKALKGGVALIALHKDPAKAYGLGGMGSAKRPRMYLTLEPKKDLSGNIMRVRKFKNWRGDINLKNRVFGFKLVRGCKIISDDPPAREY